MSPNPCEAANGIVSNLVARNWEVMFYRLERLRSDRAAQYLQAPSIERAELLHEVHGALEAAKAAFKSCDRCRAESLSGLSQNVERMEAGERVAAFALFPARRRS
jgi:hypothetical protein